MLKIRLKRVGRKNDPSFRVAVVDSRQGPKSGKDVEQVGFYNPKTKERSIDADRVKHWISVGAQPSDTVHNMLISEGVIEGKKVNVLPKKSPVVHPVKSSSPSLNSPEETQSDLTGQAGPPEAEFNRVKEEAVNVSMIEPSDESTEGSADESTPEEATETEEKEETPEVPPTEEKTSEEDTDKPENGEEDKKEQE